MAGRARGGQGIKKGVQDGKTTKNTKQCSRQTPKAMIIARCKGFLKKCGLSTDQIKKIVAQVTNDHTNDTICVYMLPSFSLEHFGLPANWRELFGFANHVDTTIGDILSHVVGNHSGSLSITIHFGESSYDLCNMQLD
jgi:hypothetical protein